jgi:NAD(P)-dependent dehydrogenase (short-subunit alcohol dehydrogenase family)
MARKVKEEVGDVCILVNNAGIMNCHPLLRHNAQEIRKTFDINVLAHFWVSFSGIYRGDDKSLARPTSRCILFDGENISFDASRVIYMGVRGGVVIKALRYKPAGRGFYSRWCHWNFSVT